MIFRINCNNHIYEVPLSDAIKVMWIVPFMSHVAASAILSPKRSVSEKPQCNDTGAQATPCHYLICKQDTWTPHVWHAKLMPASTAKWYHFRPSGCETTRLICGFGACPPSSSSVHAYHAYTIPAGSVRPHCRRPLPVTSDQLNKVSLSIVLCHTLSYVCLVEGPPPPLSLDCLQATPGHTLVAENRFEKC